MGSISLFLVTITTITSLVNSTWGLRNVVSSDEIREGRDFRVYCDALRVDIPKSVTSIDTLSISRQVGTDQTPTLIAQYAPSVPQDFKKEYKNIPYSRKWKITFNGGNGGKNNRNTMTIVMEVLDAKISDAGSYTCKVTYLTGTTPATVTTEARQNVAAYTCPRGWFGDRCQYRCGCSKGECAPNGTCLAGDRCDIWWFGPTCQYMNLVHNDGGSVFVKKASVLMDQDDSTCRRIYRDEALLVSRTDPFVFTWMMLVTKERPGHVKRPFRARALSDEIKNLPLDCINERQHLYGNTVHIYCDFKAETVKMVEISSKLSFFLCSWYISGGRNVALKQLQNSLNPAYSNYWDSNNGVDGEIASSCTRTKPGATMHRWFLAFPQPMMTKRIRIYSFKDGSSQRYIGNDGFRISVYNPDGYQVHLLEDSGQLPRLPSYTYRFRPALVSKIIVWVKGTSKDSSVFFCELEAWGDCPEGYYGLDCKTKCPYFCPKTCSVIDGQCTDVTSTAFSHPCPLECMNDCDKETGQCPGASSIGIPMIVFLIITTLGIVSALSIAGFKLLTREEPGT